MAILELTPKEKNPYNCLRELEQPPEQGTKNTYKIKKLFNKKVSWQQGQIAKEKFSKNIVSYLVK